MLHTTGGYLIYAAFTHQYVFDYHDGDIYWCTADVGWVTGHSYIVYGPLANGATTLMFEGVPNYPTTSRFWEVIDKHKVNIFYTAPTAIRALMREGEAPVKKTSRASLRLLGTVGEPINPEAWLWYHRVVGDGRCPIVDTWWQTETGGILISPLPGATDLKPGSATKPLFGIMPQLVDADGKVLEGAASGNLVLLDCWPGQMRTVYGDHQRFIDTYFKTYRGKYFTGDGCRRDEDGYYWITGRVDDVINVSGHRLGTAEVESALVAHHDVAEAAVVGYPHDIKGQGIYAYVTLKVGVTATDALNDELKQFGSARRSAPIARPDVIQFAPGLPKTRSGKIMRRILRKIAEGDTSNLGDIDHPGRSERGDDLVKNAHRNSEMSRSCSPGKIGDVKVTRVVEMRDRPFRTNTASSSRRRRRRCARCRGSIRTSSRQDGAMLLSIHALLVEAPGLKLVVDTCIGNDKPRGCCVDRRCRRLPRAHRRSRLRAREASTPSSARICMSIMSAGTRC